MGTKEGIVVAGVGDYNVGVGVGGNGGDELLLECFESDAEFCLKVFGFIFDADDGLVISYVDVRVGYTGFGHHEDDSGSPYSSL